MNFTGYTPDASKSEFCEDIPAIGRMIMVLDYEQEELRDMNVEIRIINDIGSEEKENEDLEAVTVAYREPKIYRTGTINFEHNFTEPGYFVASSRCSAITESGGFPLSVLGRKELHADAAGLYSAHHWRDRALLHLSAPPQADAANAVKPFVPRMIRSRTILRRRQPNKRDSSPLRSGVERAAQGEA